VRKAEKDYRFAVKNARSREPFHDQLCFLCQRFSMNSEIDQLLAMVDGWKFELYKKLKDLTPEQEASFWKRAQEKGLPFTIPTRKRTSKRRRSIRTV